jgi:hypothetical protein
MLIGLLLFFSKALRSEANIFHHPVHVRLKRKPAARKNRRRPRLEIATLSRIMGIAHIFPLSHYPLYSFRGKGNYAHCGQSGEWIGTVFFRTDIFLDGRRAFNYGMQPLPPGPAGR